MRLLAVAFLVGCSHITVDTMEKCSMTESKVMGMSVDQEINCTNKEYRDTVQDDPKRYKDAVDNVIIGNDGK